MLVGVFLTWEHRQISYFLFIPPSSVHAKPLGLSPNQEILSWPVHQLLIICDDSKTTDFHIGRQWKCASCFAPWSVFPIRLLTAMSAKHSFALDSRRGGCISVWFRSCFGDFTESQHRVLEWQQTQTMLAMFPPPVSTSITVSFAVGPLWPLTRTVTQLLWHFFLCTMSS